jgi:putative inorganic carbon (hco3(-)) transporter
MRNIPLKIYLLFVASWFLHLPSRVPFLGVIRFDFVLIAILSILAFLGREKGAHPVSQTDRLLGVLIAYSILTIPFAEWPGSVVKYGLPNLIKAVVFYYFTISFIKTNKDLKIFLFVFLACQSWRILEPLYLHVTEGYWGDVASMSGGSEILDRLSSGPYDVVNPNGLAFIICTIFPLLYYLGGLSWKHKVVLAVLTPPFLYALALTGSRSGVIALAAAFAGIVVKSKNRTVLAAIGMLVVVVGYGLLPPDMKDRYLSIFGEGEKNRATFEWRLGGVEEDIQVVFRRPIFGHGLGTSREANANFRGNDQLSHNLYAEVGQELGLVGLFIFLLFIGSITINFIRASKLYTAQGTVVFSKRLVDGMQVWLVMNIISSFASYGLLNYEWYLFGGLSVALLRIAEVEETGGAAAPEREKNGIISEVEISM